MKKQITIFGLFLFLTAISIDASSIDSSANSVEVAGEWLYMLPSIDQGYLVGVIFQSGSERHFAYRQDWQSGYRIEAIYNFCNCFDIRFRWTQFPSFSLSRTATTIGFDIPIPLPGSNPLIVNSSSENPTQARFDFYYFDVLLGQRLICYHSFMLGIHGGIQYMHLDLKENYANIFTPSPNTFTIVTWNSHMWGIGPEIDVECDYAIGNYFSITGKGYISLLINEKQSKRTLSSPINDTRTEAKNDRYWSINPTMGLRFGLNYSQPVNLSCFCCVGLFNLEIEGGYEAILINHGIERIFQANLFSFNEQISFALHGPYLRTGISF